MGSVGNQLSEILVRKTIGYFKEGFCSREWLSLLPSQTFPVLAPGPYSSELLALGKPPQLKP